MHSSEGTKVRWPWSCAKTQTHSLFIALILFMGKIHFYCVHKNIHIVNIGWAYFLPFLLHAVSDEQSEHDILSIQFIGTHINMIEADIDQQIH